MPDPAQNSRKKYMSDPAWAETIHRWILIEMTKRSLSYTDLSALLKKNLNVIQTPANLKTKIGRGNFGAQLLLMCLIAMDVKTIDMDQVREIKQLVDRAEGK